MNRYFSVYIHIPFCISKCDYCDFNSYANCDKYIEKYINKLIKDIEKDNSFNNEYICKTIYIGGGTPSYIDSKYIIKVIDAIKQKYTLSEDLEITIEQNPSSMNENKLLEYKQCGINRLSIGLQSTNNNMLNLIGRRHTYEMFLEKYNLARRVGFKNINIDLIIGLPSQTIQDVKNDLKNIININPEHISVYSLILEENVPMYKKIINKEYILPSEVVEREMYKRVQDTLKDNEYVQYEISNFSKENMYSRHNLMCWQQYEYIGFGAGAYSFVGNERFSNSEIIVEYIENNQIHIEEKMSKEELMKEYMVIGLRLINKIDIDRFVDKYDICMYNVFKKELEESVNEGFLQCINGKIILTEKGISLNNMLCEKFL